MKILFEHQHLYYLPQYESVIKELVDQKKHNIFASLNLSTPQIEKELFLKEVLRLEINIVEANFEPQRRRILKEMNFDLIFVGNKSSLKAIKGKNSFVIMIYHGIGLKTSYYSDLSEDMDLICVESNDRENKLKEKQFNAICTGFPKFDIPVGYNKESNKENFLLYAPTFFPSSLEKTIPILKQFDKYIIKIKLHHFFWTKAKYINQKNNLENEVKKYNNIEIVPFECYNILSLFNHSDILITDFSSVIFEYLIMDKPIIQTNYYTLRLKYKLFPALLKKRIDFERQNQINFTFNCKKPIDLLNKIEQALQNPEIHSNKRKAAVKKFLGKIDNNCSKRILNAISKSGISIGA